MARPHALVAFSKERHWAVAARPLAAHLTPTNTEAVDSFLRTPLGMLYAQTNGQFLGAKEEHRAYSGADVGKLLTAMHTQHPDGPAFEVAMTRRVTGKLKLAGTAFPCIVAPDRDLWGGSSAAVRKAKREAGKVGGWRR